MLLILSENSDLSTNHVIDWVISFDYPFVRINSDDEIELIELGLDSFTLLINGEKTISYDEIKSVWFRRGNVKIKKVSDKVLSENKFLSYLKEHINVELEAYSDYINFLLSNKRSIGSSDKMHINKFVVLREAEALGFKIPYTYVVSNKAKIYELLKENTSLITKSSNYVLDFNYEDHNYMTYTEVLNANNIDVLPNRFSPSLCQSHIDKAYDVRVFFLKGESFAMAILSQEREESKVDFRKYDYEKPERRVPFELKKNIKFMISKLMNKLDLDTGSIDLVVDKKGVNFFLEVNPVGQYGMVDFPCNYSLNKKIAKYLTHEN